MPESIWIGSEALEAIESLLLDSTVSIDFEKKTIGNYILEAEDICISLLSIFGPMTSNRTTHIHSIDQYSSWVIVQTFLFSLLPYKIPQGKHEANFVCYLKFLAENSANFALLTI